MNVDAFEARRGADWQELDRLLATAQPRELGVEQTLRLGSLYRATAADLARARRSFPAAPVTARLEALVVRGRAHVYAGAAGTRRGALRAFAARGYWRRVLERPAFLWVALGLLLGPLALGALWGLVDPGAAIGIVPSELQAAADPSGEAGEVGAGERAAFSASVFTNNIQVTFLAFATGIAAGLGTAVVLIYNGVVIGAVVGLAFDAGAGVELLGFVSAHGVLELSCIAVAAAAGLRMGWSLVEPGTLTRTRALTLEARRAVEIVLGTMPWLVLAGLVEGFVSVSTSVTVAAAIGLVLGAIFWTLMIWRGR